MAKAYSYTKIIDGVEVLFHRSAEGKLTSAPVDLEKFEQYVESIRALGPDGAQAKLAEIRGENNVAWKAAAQKKLEEVQDELRRQRLADITAEIHGR